jgi:hypothetical protein
MNEKRCVVEVFDQFLKLNKPGSYSWSDRLEELDKFMAEFLSKRKIEPADQRLIRTFERPHLAAFFVPHLFHPFKKSSMQLYMSIQFDQ